MTSKISRMGGIKVLFIYFRKKVNSYQVFLAKIVNSVSELIPTYLLVKSLIPSLKGGGINFNSPVGGSGEWTRLLALKEPRKHKHLKS